MQSVPPGLASSLALCARSIMARCGNLALFAGGAAMQALPVYVFAPMIGMIAAALVYAGLRVRV